MYRNSIAANQQEITGIVRALIFILVVQTLLSAVLSFTYRKKKQSVISERIRIDDEKGQRKHSSSILSPLEL